MAVNKGIFVRLHAKADKGDTVADFLKSAQSMAMAEAGTTAWFAVRFGPTEFGIFDVFADDAGRDAHLSGPDRQGTDGQRRGPAGAAAEDREGRRARVQALTPRRAACKAGSAAPVGQVRAGAGRSADSFAAAAA